MGTALYRKYRSKTLAEVVGQTHVTDILVRSLEKGVVSHAYLLTGPRGVGKTSIARILAHEINKLPYDDETQHLDIIEIDAASNNSVDDIRELRERVQLAPVSAAKKVYIIDEVHMLSKSAFNALLKTLEEPPAHVVFILATTNPDKMPSTVISRTQHFAFRAITPADAKEHLADIAKSEKIKINDEALELIAAHGKGSFRDSISFLDQLSVLSDEKDGITAEMVEKSLGLAPKKLVAEIAEAFSSNNLGQIVSLVEKTESMGIDPTVLSSQLIDDFRLKIVANPNFMALIDSLLEVAKSSQPSIKILTALGSHVHPKPKTAPLLAHPTSVVTPLKDLELQAEKVKPKLPKLPEIEPVAIKTVEEIKPKTVSKKMAGDINFDWAKVVEYSKKNSVAVFSVLSKCSHELVDDTLKIYAVNKFYKKKLDDAKYRSFLLEALEKNGAAGLVVDIIPTVCPPKDSTAASVAAIMGGGEEVSLEI